MTHSSLLAHNNGEESRSAFSSANLSYWTDTTEGSTLESEKLRYWTEKHLEDAESILNPCAGTAKLDVDGEVLRIDINPEADADLHIDFRDLPNHVEPSAFDAIVYDPPYSWNQAVNKYDLEMDRDEFYFYTANVKRLFDQLLAPGGVFIQYGYTTEMMPADLGYEVESVALFNKLGSQNDYLASASRKPVDSTNPAGSLILEETVTANDGADQITDSNVTAGGNGGASIEMQYRRPNHTEDFGQELSATVNRWIDSSDRVLHIYQDEPRVRPAGKTYTCAYSCIDLGGLDAPVDADVVETPWNIGSRFATGVFDAVILDIPYSAFQTTIRTPRKEANSGPSDRTHIHTAIKRSISDLVSGNGGRVLQIGQTATLMSGHDYDYRRRGVGIIRHGKHDHDWIVAVDEKPHENLEVIGLGSGEVEAYSSHPMREHGSISSKHRRTDVEPDPDSHFCVHCGNSYYHHPAAYTDCHACGARPGSTCVTDSGTPITPSGPNHRIAEQDLHPARLEDAQKTHSGLCNEKEPTYLSADPEAVDQFVNALSSHSHFSEFQLVAEKQVEQLIREHIAPSPRSTDIIEQVTSQLRRGGSKTNDVSNSPKSTTKTLLTDFTEV